MTKATKARNMRLDKLVDLDRIFSNGYQAGVNALAAQLATPEGVLMKDGRVARIVYFPATLPDGAAPLIPGDTEAANAPGVPPQELPHGTSL